jgi:hypothetical protein
MTFQISTACFQRDTYIVIHILIPPHIYPEDGSYNVCQTRTPLTYNVAKAKCQSYALDAGHED